MLDFPASPTNGQLYNASNGVTYQWVSSTSIWIAQGAWSPPPVISAGTVSLDQFIASPNPLQAAFDFLGPNGGTIYVSNFEYSIPGQCVAGVNYATSNLRTMALIGVGPDSVLNFPNGGGIVMYFATPSGIDHTRDQLLVDRLSIITTQYTSTSVGSGTGLAASFAVAVGDTTPGVTLRDLQIGNKSQAATSATTAQWWNTCIQLYNARNVRLSGINTNNVSLFGGSFLPPLGNGIDLNGGTVEIEMSDIRCNHHVRGVYVNGVCEGVQWNRGVCIGNTNGIWIDGDVDGRARSTSSTSQTIGTGSKTFTVAHNIQGPDGLAWTTNGAALVVRDTANPTVNTMTGTVTAFSGNSVTINVTSTAGAGTISSWTLSTEHKVSQVVIDDVHCNNQTRNIYLRWVAFTSLTNLMMQPRDDGTLDPFWQIELAQECSVTFIDNVALSSLVLTAQVKGGIAVRGVTALPVWTVASTNARVFYTTISNVTFTESAFNVGVLIEDPAQSVDVHAVRSPGTFVSGKMIDNQVVAANFNVKVYECVNDGANVNAWTVFPANVATPTVAMDGRNRWRTANSSPTTITSFIGGCVGEKFRVLVNDVNTTFAHNANLLMQQGIAYAPTNGSIIEFMRESTTIVRENTRYAANGYVGYAKTYSATVANLNAAGSVIAGASSRAFVTDSTVVAAGNFGNVVVGGGVNSVPVYSDGGNWRIG